MGTFTASADLPSIVTAPRAARHLVKHLLEVWNSGHSVTDAQLLVTELVSNAVDHAGGEASLSLQLTLSDGWLRISLADGSSIRPIVRELDHTSPRGRGMQLVAAIAGRWGCEDHEGGKRVWFELGPPGQRATRDGDPAP
ncbi:MAG TPA: ATP-binding protein [Pseudonocardiaceae bacterium]